VEDSWASGDVTNNGSNYLGGLIGFATGTPVSGSWATGLVEESEVGSGGLIGYALNSEVTNSHATGDVVDGDDSAGGLIGLADNSPVSESWAIGSIDAGASEDFGGLIGTTVSSPVANSWASGAITNGGENTGGLIGNAAGNITNSYARGSVTATGADVGGLVGKLTSGTVSSSYWDTETSGLSASDGGRGKTTEEMKDITTFQAGSWSIVSGWSSGAVWGICPAVNSGYPFLSAFYASNPCINSNEARFQFTFWLPDGRECTSISPVIVTRGDLFTLPGADALCQTMDGSLVDGWVIPLPEGFVGVGTPELPFRPGQKVRVSDSQQFTVVPFEPVLSLTLDSNVGVDQMCEPTDATFVDESHQLEYSWVPRVDVSMARLPVQAACQPPGYALAGWNTAADGSGTMFEPGSGVPSLWATDKTNRHRLFAIWAPV